MKHLLPLCLCLLLLASACKKETKPTTGAFSLTGKWRLVLITGGYANIHETAAEWGHYASYTFKADSTCVRVFDHDTTINSYHIWMDSSYGYPQQVISIGSGPMDLGVAHDTLVLGMHNVSDGTAEWYVKE